MSDSEFSVRQLTREDLQPMRELLNVFGEAFDDVATYTAMQPDASYLGQLLGTDYFIALAAMQAGEVIGGLAAYELKKFEQRRSEIYIYDLAVAARYRRKGIARALIQELQRIAAVRGAWMIFVQADYGDDPAIALYSQMGKREDVLHFDILPSY